MTHYVQTRRSYDLSDVGREASASLAEGGVCMRSAARFTRAMRTHMLSLTHRNRIDAQIQPRGGWRGPFRFRLPAIREEACADHRPEGRRPASENCWRPGCSPNS